MSTTEQGHAPSADADLDARYGRSPGGAKRRRRLIWAAAAAFAVVLVAWVVWGSGIADSSKVDPIDAGYEIVVEDVAPFAAGAADDEDLDTP